jgi:hypothetical protein
MKMDLAHHWGAMAIAASLVSGPVFAAGNEPARLRVAGALVDDVVRSLLPVMLPGPGAGPGKDGAAPSAAILTEIRYCGATDKGAGLFRAVIRQTALDSGAPFLLPAGEACRPALADLAKQLAAPVAGVAIADLQATWKPWELRLALLRSIALAPSKSAPISDLDNRRNLWTISTSDLGLPADAGEPIILHVAPRFAAGAIEIAVVVGERGSATPTPSGHSGPSAAPLGEANLTADIPVSFANQVLRRLTWTQPLAISVDSDVVDLENLTIAQEKSGLTIHGNATPRSIRETVRFTVAMNGEDLRLASVLTQGQMENCAGQGAFATVACNLRNSARQGVAGALGATLTQRYQGQLVRELVGQRSLGFSVGVRRLEIHGDLLRLSCGAAALSSAARFEAGGTSKESGSAM